MRAWVWGCGDGGGGGCFFFGRVCGDGWGGLVWTRGVGVGVVVSWSGSAMLECCVGCGVVGHCCNWRIMLLTCISGLNR